MSKELATNKNNDLKSMIVKMKKQFELALPKHLTPDRFMRIALTAVAKNPKLLNCTQHSVMSCLMDCSQLGLEPDGRKVHLIPYGTQCTLIIDYKGLVDLARRGGEIADIHADVVHDNDDFEYSFGVEYTLKHKPTLKEKGEVIAAYSFCRLKDGTFSFEVMSKPEIEAIRKRSKASNSGPWVSDWNEMAKKTVFRRHAKWLPLSAEYQDAIDKDGDIPVDIKNNVVVDANLVNPFEDVKTEITEKEQEEKVIDLKNDPDLDTRVITDAQLKRLMAISKNNGISEEKLNEHILNAYELESKKDIQRWQYDSIVSFCEIQEREPGEEG